MTPRNIGVDIVSGVGYSRAMNTNRRYAKCSVCEARIINGPHTLCDKGENTAYRIPETQVIINRAESIVRRAGWAK